MAPFLLHWLGLSVSCRISPKKEVIVIIPQPKERLQVTCPRKIFTAKQQRQDCTEKGTVMQTGEEIFI